MSRGMGVSALSWWHNLSQQVNKGMPVIPQCAFRISNYRKFAGVLADGDGLFFD